MLGYSENELLSMTFREVTYPDDLEQSNEWVQKLIAGSITSMDLEKRYLHKSGNVVWGVVRAILLSDDSGSPLFFSTYIQDITERKQAEEQVKRLNESMGLAMEASKAGTWDWDITNNTFIWSSEFLKLFGMPHDTVAGFEAWRNSLHPEDREIAAKKIQDSINDKTELKNDYRIILPNQEIHWIRAIGKTFYDKDTPMRMTGICIDITERKQAEETLRFSEEKYRLVVEKAQDAIVILQDGKLKFANHQTIVLSGYSEEEMTNVPFSSFIHAEDRDMVTDMHRKRLLGENIPSTYSCRFVNKAGETIWVQITGVLITWKDRPAALIFLKDITIQKKLEAQLLQSQKMEAIGILAGGVAHNFNNLLMTILGYTYFMLMKTEKTHPFYEQLKIIEKQVENGAELTKQLLGFARGGKYEVKALNVNDLIIQTSDTFGKTKKEITIHKKLQEDLHAIKADKGQIEQVLLNLYVNAWQAMPSGGSLYLETQNAVVDEHQGYAYSIKPGPYVKITVADTGLGMDSETQKRIFEPFFSTKGVGQGTGLGLASAYGIIRNHGGIIDVYSDKGHCTTFTVFLPASEKEVTETKPAEGSLITGHETILIVDDEKEVLLAVKALLDELGYKILTAQSGKEAIELYKKHSKDIKLVILDLIMPEINGQETAVKLMEIDKNVCVLLSSGYSIDAEDKASIDFGCKGFIQKPYRIEELSRKIRTVLSPGDS
jgi:two-component system, cell cycle sensor histidine kinase and response regulator CckA